MELMGSNNSLWKNNRKDQQFENEILLLKEAFYRVSKRVVVLETFLKTKFDPEFPPQFGVNIQEINSNNRSRTLKRATASSIARTKFQPLGTGTSNLRAESNDDRFNPSQNASSGDVFTTDAHGLPPPVDLRPNDTSCHKAQYYNDGIMDINHQDGPSSVESEVVIEHDIVPNSNENNEDVLNNSDSEVDDAQKHDDNDSDYEGTDQMSAGSEMDIPGPPFGSDPKLSKKLAKAERKKRMAKINHKNDKLVCEICSKIFLGHGARCNLKAHMDTHSTEKKYKCTECDNAFRQRRTLRTHMQRIHFRDKYAIHACQFCDKTFVALSEKKQHEVVHSNEKPYTCEICGSQFKLALYLKSHLQTHTDQKKDHLCPECGKAFGNRDLLRQHTRNVHRRKLGPDGKKLKPHVCEICSMTFSAVHTLKRHMGNIHGSKTDPTVQSNTRQRERKDPTVSKRDSKEVSKAASSKLP